MVSDKSIANLKKGNTKNVGRKKGKTWKELIDEIGAKKPPKEFAELGKTWREVVINRAYVHAALGNAPILRELMQRSEPQDPLFMNIDLSKLSLQQLERLSNGEDPRAVIFAGAGGD